MGYQLNLNWEDMEFKTNNENRLSGSLTPQQWRGAFLSICSRRNSPWGYKDPRTAHFIDEVQCLLPTAKYIFCVRNLVDTIASCVKNYGKTYSDWEPIIVERDRKLNQFLPLDRTLILSFADIQEENFSSVKRFI